MFGKYYGLRGNQLQIAIGVIAGLDFLLFGYDQGVMGGLLSLPSFRAQFPQIDTSGESQASHKATIQGITIASYNLGCFAGAVMCIFIGDILGRKRTIFLGSIIMVIGAAIQASAFANGQLVAGRIITGIGNGFNTSTVPTWQSETSKAHKRGQMVMIEGALITGGIMLSYWLDFGFSFLEGSISWRFPIAFQIVFALIIFLMILGFPESPRWLILRGREDEAMDVLASLNDLPEDDEYIVNEFASIKDTVLEMSSAGFADVFTMGPDRNFHRAMLGSLSQMAQQISGINLITYYATVIYESIGLSGRNARILAAANGTEYFLASWVAVFTIEKIGRRPLMLFGAVGQAASMAILAGCNYHEGGKSGIVAAVFLFVFNSFFAIGWLGMTWLYPAEIVPLRIRAPSNALSTATNWIFNFMVVMITPVAFANIKWRTYLIFAVINAALVPMVYFFYPETAYRSLEEMDDIFRQSTSVFDVVRLSSPKVTPNKFDKYGNPVESYIDTEQHRRLSSVVPGGTSGKRRTEDADRVENKERSDQNESYHMEGGFSGANNNSGDSIENIEKKEE